MFTDPQEQEEPYNFEYRVESIEKTEPPSGMPGDNWHRYVIGRGSSKIEGLKPGSMSDVRQHAEAVADDLNERSKRKGSTYASRQKK